MIYQIWAAFFVDCLIGDPYFFPHPVRAMGAFIKWYERQIRRLVKGEKALYFSGIGLAFSLIGISYVLTWGIIFLFSQWNLWAGRLISIMLMWNCLALKCLKKECKKVYDFLSNNQTEQARKQISFLVSRDTENLDKKGISKAAVETAAENISDGIIAPLFYLFIGGAPLAMAYKAINTMDSMIGYENDEYKNFGRFPAKFDDAVNFIPARLTGYFLVVFAFVMRFNYKDGLRILKRDHAKSKSPNAGWPESAVAGILGIEICGPTSYFGKITAKPVIGEKRKELETADIKVTCFLATGTAVLVLIMGSIARIFLNYLFT